MTFMSKKVEQFDRFDDNIDLHTLVERELIFWLGTFKSRFAPFISDVTQIRSKFILVATYVNKNCEFKYASHGTQVLTLCLPTPCPVKAYRIL